MNIQNVADLAKQLKAIGFENTGYSLLKLICLAPANFSITEKLTGVPENISFIFYFEREDKGPGYKLAYYDAVLQHHISFEYATVGGQNVKSIDVDMMQIDWNDAFDFSRRKVFNADEKSTYANEARIAQIVERLNTLESTEEGKVLAIALKQKYWASLPYMEVMGIMSNGRNKSEISQRFYFGEGQPLISSDEAYRFLLNRWMEKQMLSKKKHQQNDAETEAGESGVIPGSGLLRKRRAGSNRKQKST